ncbi:shikimate kinase [Exiguobacterium sp. KRL4]|uniref:shikimate kinase n=1 Tax=Exiguobacterium sp. KRL4 TaxID=1914536 RepID=UPI0008F93137|nr:shikimate kinase [Exiguobacterium sp. KRL4]OIN68467.1 shikimate kinase [Exiguobacterium sp. KRL4]
MDKVYLIGFMGTGKTAIGRNLKARYSVDELDERFVQEHGPITEFFKQHGETGFRKQEVELLQRSQAQIVVTGGGVIERPENRLFMKETGTIFWIDTPFHIVWNRIKTDPSRPLVKSRSTVEKLFRRRRPLYARAADVRLDGTKSVRELTKEIETLLEENV